MAARAVAERDNQQNQRKAKYDEFTVSELEKNGLQRKALETQKGFSPNFFGNVQQKNR